MSRAMAGLPEGVANVHQATPAQLVDFIVTAGMEVDEIATDLDVHPRTVGLWRTGERWPQRRNWDNLMRLAARGAQRMTAPSTWQVDSRCASGSRDAGFQQSVHLGFRDELTAFIQRVINRRQLPGSNPAPHGGRAHLQPLACLAHRQHFLTLFSHFIAVSHKIPVIVIRFYSFPFVTMKTNRNIREQLKTKGLKHASA